jgi:hypothetical protein
VEVLNENIDELFQSGSSSYICTSCHRSLTNFAEFKRQINSKLTQLKNDENSFELINDCSFRIKQESDTADHFVAANPLSDPFAIEDAIKTEFPTDNDVKYEETPEERLEPELKLDENLDRRKVSLKTSCLDCGALLQSNDLLKHRIEFHLSEFVCDVCCRSFRSKFLLLKHIRNHFHDDKFKCDVCSKDFSNNKQLIAHQNRFHSDFLQFTCENCEEIHDDKKSMMKCRDSHGLKKKSSTGSFKSCQICGKKMKSNSIYSHIRLVHNKERDKICQICGKALKTSYDLKVHLRQHSGERPEICETCGKTFVSYAQLYKHRKVRHMVRDNFECSICQKVLLSRFKLKLHGERFHPNGLDNGIRVDSTTNCYHCEICGLKFVAMHKYEKHLKLNDCHKYEGLSGEKEESSDGKGEFKCQECGR